MGIYQSVVRGAQAGAITAGAVETSFFVFDLVRLQPLATPAALAGAGLSPGGAPLDLTSVAGAAAVGWAAYQLWLLTLAHFSAFAVAGIGASLAFDWTRAGGVARFAALAVVCLAALLVAVGLTSSIVNLSGIGMGAGTTMIVLAPTILYALLRVLSMPEDQEGSPPETP